MNPNFFLVTLSFVIAVAIITIYEEQKLKKVEK